MADYDLNTVAQILQVGSAGLAFFFGLFGYNATSSWIRSQNGSGSIADFPPRYYKFLMSWLSVTLIMFFGSCYFNWVVKPVQARVAISSSKFMSNEKMNVTVTVGDKNVSIPIESSQGAQDRATFSLDNNAQVDVNIDKIVEGYQILKAVSSAQIPQNATYQGASE